MQKQTENGRGAQRLLEAPTGSFKKLESDLAGAKVKAGFCEPEQRKLEKF
jgi:hypothetical protein